MKRLTRKEIEVGLESMPIDTILLGAVNAKTTKLTHKQKAFAKEVALGNTKAESYRRAYKSKAKPQVASQEGQKLMKNPAIAMQVDAIALALEANQHITPASLRALAIHKLTEKAIDPDVPVAQQLRALELLGKITEVALFTERREIVQTSNSGEMKDKLLQSIRLALSSKGATDVQANDAESLLAEIAGVSDDMDDDGSLEMDSDDVVDNVVEQTEDGVASSNGNPTNPLHPDPQFLGIGQEPYLHSIPDIQSPQNNRLTPVSLSTPLESDTCESSSNNPNKDDGLLTGGGGIKNDGKN
jgi:hypothetical protein